MSLFGFGQKRCVHRHTIHTHPHCFDASGNPRECVVHNFPKILSLDVETLPLLTFTWGVWKQNIYPEQIKKDWCLLSYSAKWIGSSNIISNVLSSREAVNRDDENISNDLWKLLEEADIIIGFNSKRFDIKKINTRFWKHGFHRPSSYKHIDIFSAAKSVFGLTYNRLNFVAKFKGIQQKLDTDFELWDRCDAGDKRSLQKMREYNEQDVLIQEDVYFNIREWIPDHPDLSLYTPLEGVCPLCLGNDYNEIGLYTSGSRRYKEYRCSCGAIWHDKKSIKLQKNTNMSGT